MLLTLHAVVSQATCTTDADCAPTNQVCNCASSSRRRKLKKSPRDKAAPGFVGRRLFGAPTATCTCASPPAPPRSCEEAYTNGNTISGIYTLQPRGTTTWSTSSVSVRAYCDMTTTPKGQSIFDTPDGTQSFVTGTNECVLYYYNDDNDNTMMWVDLSGRQGALNTMATTTALQYFVVPRGSNPGSVVDGNKNYLWGSTSTTDQHFPSTIAGVSPYARPIPFPRSGMPNGVVVWLDSKALHFRADGMDYTMPYPTAMTSGCTTSDDTNTNPRPTCCRPRADAFVYNVNVFISDGISSVTIGRRIAYATDDMQCAVVLSFDWSSPTYDSSMLSATANTTRLSIPPNGRWMDTEEDHMGGDLLWTVLGKPSYFSNCQMLLGSSMLNPFLTFRSDPVTATSSTPIAGSSTSGTCNSQSGMDIFLKVDLTGNLWAGDWGHDNGGLFGCGNDNHLGSMRTNIRLVT